MCGRFARTSSRDSLAAEFGVAEFVNVDLRPRYNIAPSQGVEAIIRDGAELRCGPMRWGFMASAVASAVAPINARAETVAKTGMFRDAFRRRRCLVVADGFYEWRQDGGSRKTPHFIHLRSQQPFSFAGIWSSQRTPMGQRVGTCAILTCAPNELMATIHNRMPVILEPAARGRWLDPQASESELQSLLVPLPAEQMEAWAVSVFVNSPRNDGPECVRRVEN